jgi:hypothetical protein
MSENSVIDEDWLGKRAAVQLSETTMRLSKSVEIQVRLDSLVPEKMLDFVVAEGVQVAACCSYYDRHGPVMLMVTDDNVLATAILEAAGCRCKSDSVVTVEVRGHPAAVARLGMRLSSAGLGILHSYATRAKDDRSVTIFKTTNDDQAIALLQTQPPEMPGYL